MATLQKLKKLLLMLAYSNLWIALSAGGQVYVNFWILGVPASATAMLLATLGIFSVYTFAKAVHFDPEADMANDPDRTSFLKAHRPVLIGAGLTALLWGTNVAYQHSPLTALIFWTPIVIGLFYDLKLFPRSFTYRRLKDIPGVKGTSVALAWTILVLGLGARYGMSADSSTWTVLAAWNFLMWFINTTYFDLGDIHGDRLEGTMTLPVLLGYEQTRFGLHLLNLTAFALLATACGTLPLREGASVLLVLHVFQMLLIARAKDESTDLGWECDVLADGLFIVAAGLTLLVHLS